MVKAITPSVPCALAGYVTKDQPTEQVISARGRVAQGKLVVSDKIQERLLRRLIGGIEDTDAIEVGSFSSPTASWKSFASLGQARDT